MGPSTSAIRPAHTGPGARLAEALEDARETVARILDADPDEVIFTSGATEANNLALFGLAGSQPGPILASPLEHPSVAEPLVRLAARGFSTQALSVTDSGIVSLAGFAERLGADTRLVSVMLANNETGAIQPIAELATLLAGQAPFHCDAAQAVGRLPVSFHGLGVTAPDLEVRHKFQGPKGVGALLLRKAAR